MVEVIKIMATSFQSSHARSATLSASDHAIGHHQPTPLPETLGHSQASLGLWGHCSFLLDPGAHKVMFMLSKSLRQRCGSAVAYCRVGHTACSSARMGPFEGGPHYLHYLHHSLASGQTTEREHSPAHQQKIGLTIYRAWPHPSEQDHFPFSHALPSGSFYEPLILLHQWAHRMKITVTEN